MTKLGKSPGLLLLVLSFGLLFRSSCMAVPTPNGHLRARSYFASSAASGTHHGKHARNLPPAPVFTASDVFNALSDGPNGPITASLMAASVPKTSSLKSINLSNANLTLTAGVYTLSKFQLDHSTLTLSGPGYFIFNITGGLTLNAGKVLLANGATEFNTFFNYKGPAQALISNGINAAGNGYDSVLHGILLSLNTQANFAPGLVVGEIITQNAAGGYSEIVTPQPAGLTIPDNGSTFGLSVAALIGIALFRLFMPRVRLSPRPV